ncbi:MAG: carboxypeptidase regulatory-like domain-containing protein, partial [Verrucomicrobiota bacterium]|nr:carboxypeptidase regulatory-like domain-containing protein [Verrucomicrobiota bacterium]
SRKELEEAELNVEMQKAALKGDDGEVARLRLRKAEANFEQVRVLHAAKEASSSELEKAKLNVEIQKAALKRDDPDWGGREQLDADRRSEQRRTELEKTPDTKAAPAEGKPSSSPDDSSNSAAPEPKIGGAATSREQLRPAEAEAVLKNVQRALVEKQNGADPRALPVVASETKGELSGRVVDRHGNPVADVLVDAWDWCPGNETHTAADGSFRLAKLDSDKRVEVRFIKPSFAPYTIIKQPLGAMTAPVVLDDETYLEGVVTAPDGMPVPNALIRANQGPKQADGVHISTIWTETHSDAQGRYRLLVQDDTYDLQVTSPTGLVARLPKVTIARGNAVPLDLRLEPGVIFRAKILDSQTGEGVAGVRLNRWQHRGLEGTTNAQGELEIRGLIPGPFEFAVEASGYARWWSEECSEASDRRQIRDNGWQRNFDSLHFELTSNMAPVTITLEKAVRVRGRILDPAGNPVKGATAAPALTGTGNSITGDTRFSVLTKEDGSFEMFLPASGDSEYNLIAHDGGYKEWRKWANGVSEPFATTPDQQIESFELKLNRPSTVRGRVLNSAGRPVSDRDVRASAADLRDNRYYDPTSRTDGQGRFDLKFIRPGKHSVQVAPFWLHPDSAPANASQAVELVESQTLEIPDLTAPDAS